MRNGILFYTQFPAAWPAPKKAKLLDFFEIHKLQETICP
ncbi:Hypothetical protein I595_310 [Croceitalea dokdonensis DOKDO 023]|uniref:Uncharacterized protein n=1 Tax=Croceitalea dokdonensis DOKDO 023 TaxID=1300341 RepID=A0A0P7AXA1_9FLAO|nr:Hypothetical protein I595_310 [Croceitalea dokdonensis DOKDO 023]